MSNNENKKNEERQKLQLVISEKEKFNGDDRIEYRSSTTLAASVNSIFKDIFKDYNGCYLEINNTDKNSPVTVVMDFVPGKDNGQGGEFRAFKKIGEDDTKKSIGKIAADIIQHNRMLATKETYEITQDAVDLLYDLLIPDLKCSMKAFPKAFQSHGVYIEGLTTEGNYYGSNIIYHEYVKFVDMQAILRKILPEKNDNGNKVIYTIVPVNALPYNYGDMFNGGLKYLFAITQLDLVAMENLVKEYGPSDPNIQNRVITV